MIGTSDIELIAYNEGWLAFVNDVCVTQNPYDGVMTKLHTAWENGWYDGFTITNNGDYQGPHPKYKCYYAVI